MIQTIADSFGRDEKQIEDLLRYDKHIHLLDEFLEGKGSPKVFIYYQPSESGDGVTDLNHGHFELCITDGESEKLKEKAIYFYRNLPEGRSVNTHEGYDNEVLFGELSPNTIVQIDGVMNNIYEPMINAIDNPEWGECSEEFKQEFLLVTKKFANDLGETIKSLSNGYTITTFDHKEYNAKTNEKEKIEFLQRHFARWLDEIEKLLKDDWEQRKESPDAGPRTELEYWRSRMQKITSLNEQLKTPDFLHAKNALLRERSKDPKQRGNEENYQKLMSQYNLIDISITDKLNEAKDNVKYLTTLEKFIEPLYTGTPQEIIDTLPALMSAIKMIYTIARYYNTTDKMTNLFIKITNQMISNCKSRLQEGRNTDKIWDRDPAELIAELRSCINLNHAYQEQYNLVRGKVADLLKGKHFDFSVTAIFGKFDLFCRRVSKLIDIFSTIMQFNALKRHSFEGIETITDKFDHLISTFRGKRYDLLDYQNNKFDREFVQFNVEIASLDNDLQNFINSNFSRFRNIEYSLKLLKKIRKYSYQRLLKTRFIFKI